MSIAWDIAACIASVVPRRLARGPRHPSWSLPYEIGAEVCGRQVAPDRVLTPAGRKPQGVTPIPVALRGRLAFERTVLAGLATEQHTPRSWQADGQLLLFLHGGGYFACSPGTHRALISRIAVATGARCVAPDYRLAPEHPFPSGIDDCVAAYHALLEGGTDPSRIFIGGDSAGGGLTLAVLQRLRDAGEPLPRAALLLSPFVDATAEGGSLEDNARYDYLPDDRERIVGLYTNGADAAHPHISPVNADLRGLPPMLMLTGALEILLDQNVALAERARAHGVDVTHVIEDGMVHVYPLLADVSAVARRSFRHMAALFANHA